MKKNRKVTKKMSVVAANTMRFAAIIVSFFVMVILNHISSSVCTQMLKTKGTLERELAKLEESRMREATRWEEMKIPERVERSLLRNGLSMKIPRSEQCVRMNQNGTLVPCQHSVAKAKQRLGLGEIGMTTRQTQSSKYRSPRRSR